MNTSEQYPGNLNDPFIPQRADPFILHHTDGKYYFTASVPEYDCIILRCADTLAQLQNTEEVTVWRRHRQGIMSTHIWAPELHFLDGAWYLYFAAGDVDDKWAIRPYILRCTDGDPIQGNWEECGMMNRADDFSFNDFSLDMTVFEYHKQRYAVWAEKVNFGNKISNLYIAKMDSPTRLKTPQMLLSFPSYDWERIGFWVNEGPAFLPGKEHIYITYSASETGADYCMGLLAADQDSALLDPNSWKKTKEPVLKTNVRVGLYGPGHNSFFVDSNGDTMMAYHARPYRDIIGDPLYDPNRHCYLMKIIWENDVPIFSFSNNLVF